MRTRFHAANTLGFLLVIALAILLSDAAVAQGADAHADAHAKVKAYELSCIGNLRVIKAAQGAYQGGDFKKGYARDLRKLGPQGENIIVPALASGKKDGYYFILKPGPMETGKPVSKYTVSARPIKLTAKGQRSFFTDETGVIRATTKNRKATAADPPIN